VKQLNDFPTGVIRLGGRMLKSECEGRSFTLSGGGGARSCWCGTTSLAQLPYEGSHVHATVCGVCDLGFEIPRVKG
jgi:hypothetical protein